MKLTLRVETVGGEPPSEKIVQVFDARGGSIGRARTNDMILDDPERIVSGRHAHVLLRDERYFLIDTSQNGTYLNDAGEAIGWCKSAELLHGDYVRIGPFSIAVAIGPSEHEAATVEIPADVLAEMRKARWGDDADLVTPVAEAPAIPLADMPTEEIPADVLEAMRKTRWDVDADAAASAEPTNTPTPAPVNEDMPTEEIPADILKEMRAKRWGAELDVVEPDAHAVASGSQLFEESPTIAAQTLTEYSADVLVIDDDEEISYFVKFMLERAGHSVLVAGDGLSALKFIDENAPTRMVVLDVVLPHLDGFQLIDAMRSNRSWRGVPIIMLSELAGEQDIVRALNAGALDYVVKPFKPTELVARLQRFLPK